MAIIKHVICVVQCATVLKAMIKATYVGLIAAVNCSSLQWRANVN